MAVHMKVDDLWDVASCILGKCYNVSKKTAVGFK
jgi:hypothetical protein